MKKIAIIGSGITALTYAWKLSQRGYDCRVYESSDATGGSIQSLRKGDYLAEEGPNSIQVGTSQLDQFIRSIPNLEERIVEAMPAAKKRFIVRDGKLHAVPMNPIQAVTTTLWSFAGRLRVLREPFIGPAVNEDQSAADFVRRRLGEELYQYAINPLIGGIYAGDPEQLSLRYAFPKLYALEKNHGGLIRGGLAKMREAKQNRNTAFKKRIISFQDGLSELPEHLTHALGQKVHTSVSIQSIRKLDSTWEIETATTKEAVDQIVVTTPAHRLLNLPFDHELHERLKALQAIDYPPVSVLTMAYHRKDIEHPLDGFGALVPECEGRSILGVLFPSSVFTKRCPTGEVLLTVFVGGERQPELANQDSEPLQNMVESELQDLLGLRGKSTFIHHRHWPRAIPQYKIGYGHILKSIDQIESDFTGLKLKGNYRTGISLSYCIESSISDVTENYPDLS